jgi:hypothetical protein
VCRYGWFAPDNSRSLQEPPDGLLSFYFRSKILLTPATLHLHFHEWHCQKRLDRSDHRSN